jgi:hypothetical protein
MKFYTNLIKIILISKILSIEFLESFKEKQISCDKEFIILDSSGFKKKEKIYLEMEAKRFRKDFINYEFIDDISSYVNETSIPFHEKDSKNHEYSTKTSIKREFDTPTLATKYFTIKKSIKKGKEGHYLLILFYCEGDVLIKNTEKNNGSSFVLKGVFIIIFCIILLIFMIIIALLQKKIENKSSNLQKEDNKNENEIENENENTKTEKIIIYKSQSNKLNEK